MEIIDVLIATRSSQGNTPIELLKNDFESKIWYFNDCLLQMALTYPSFKHGSVILAFCQIVNTKMARVFLLEQICNLISIISIRSLHARRRERHRFINRLKLDTCLIYLLRSRIRLRTYDTVCNVR